MFKRVFPLLLPLLIFLLSVQPVAAVTITLVADEWAPFNISPDKKPEGYIVDIAREVFKSHDIDVIYQVVPWKRALEGTRKGEYTAAIGPTKNEAPYLIFPKEELAINRLSFWVKKGNNWRFTKRDSLKSVSLGVIEGYDYRQWLNTYMQKNIKNSAMIQVVNGSKPMEMNIQKLMAGRIGALVDNEAVVRFMAKQLGVQDSIELAGYDAEPAYCYIGFSPADKNSSRYARMLSEGIDRLRKSGRLKQILAGYGLQDWKNR